MKGCFTYCESLTSSDLSSLNTSICVKVWNPSKVENMSYCFAGCTFLAYHNIENWDVFNGCDNLSLVKCSKETFDKLFNAYWWT